MRFSLEQFHHLTGTLVDSVLLLGAIAAVIKFRLFNILGYRWRSELECSHSVLPDSSVIFTADYTIFNTGQRPLQISDVTLRVTAAKLEAELLIPDEDTVYAERVFQPSDPALKGLFQIEPGERTIFPIRAKLSTLDDAVFVLCGFKFPSKKRVPASYRGFYAKSHPPRAKTPASPLAQPNPIGTIPLP